MYSLINPVVVQGTTTENKRLIERCASRTHLCDVAF